MKTSELSDNLKIVVNKLSAKKSGKYYLAKCPFHIEKTGSFVIDPHTEKYHCFGCGKNGGIDSISQEQRQKETTIEEMMEAVEFCDKWRKGEINTEVLLEELQKRGLPK